VGTTAVTSVVVTSTAVSTTAGTTLGAQAAATSSQSTASSVIANFQISGGSSNPTSTIGGARNPQLFWIMLNNYQMIEVFLLFATEFHQSMIALLESINYATFNLNWIPIPFIEKFKSKIEFWVGPNSPSLLEYRLQKAGFEIMCSLLTISISSCS